MLKRNINVYRRANQRLKEIKRQKSAISSSRRGETLRESIGTTIIHNDSMIHGGDSLMMVDLNTGSYPFNR